MILPSRITTAPTGTSLASYAFCAMRKASRMKDSSLDGSSIVTSCSHGPVGRPIHNGFVLAGHRPVATERAHLPKEFLGHITDCSCTATLNRIWSRHAFSNRPGTSAARRGSKVSLNIGECTANPSGNPQNSGRERQANSSGGQDGKRSSNGRRLLQSG